MSPAEAQSLIRTVRRHFRAAWGLRILLLGVIGTSFALGLIREETTGQAGPIWTVAFLAVIFWFGLMASSIRQARAANQGTQYIASGRLDLAETHLKNALQGFSLYRFGKLLVCHNLAVVAHGRREYQAAADLCDGILSVARNQSRSLSRLCRILLADCRLLLGDSAAAMKALAPLDADHADMTINEKLVLLPIELRCLIACGDFAAVVASLAEKIKLSELLESPKAALTHALLARACRETGRTSQAAFLQRRAELYHDLGELEAQYSIRLDSEPVATSADNNIDNAPQDKLSGPTGPLP